MGRLTIKFGGLGLLLFGAIFICLFGCSKNSAYDLEDDDAINVDDDDGGQNGEVSDCGGFSDEFYKLDESDYDDSDKSEKLIWKYDSADQTVTFLNKNVCLNCCGEHSIEIVRDGFGTYEIKETDEPLIIEGEETRCLCMCFYDFKISLLHSAEIISLKITRYITDEGDRFEVWSGRIDLTEGSGKITITESGGDCA